jgi:hypothetical protein
MKPKLSNSIVYTLHHKLDPNLQFESNFEKKCPGQLNKFISIKLFNPISSLITINIFYNLHNFLYDYIETLKQHNINNHRYET